MKLVRKMRKKKSLYSMCIGTEVVLSFKDMIIMIQRSKLNDTYSLIYICKFLICRIKATIWPIR